MKNKSVRAEKSKANFRLILICSKIKFSFLFFFVFLYSHSHSLVICQMAKCNPFLDFEKNTKIYIGKNFHSVEFFIFRYKNIFDESCFRFNFFYEIEINGKKCRSGMSQIGCLWFVSLFSLYAFFLHIKYVFCYL